MAPGGRTQVKIRSVHRAAARLLIAGYESACVARLIGVGRSQLTKWVADPSFQEFWAQLEARTNRRRALASEDDGLLLDRLEPLLSSPNARLRQRAVTAALEALAEQPLPTTDDDVAIPYQRGNEGR